MCCRPVTFDPFDPSSEVAVCHSVDDLLPYIHLLDGGLVLLASLTVPLVVAVKHLLFAVLSEALLEGEAARTAFGLGGDRDAKVHQRIELGGSEVADGALESRLELPLKEVNYH